MITPHNSAGQLLASLLLIGAGAVVVWAWPTAGLLYTAGAGVIGSGLGTLVDWVESPATPPDRLSIAVWAGAFILVAGW